MKIEMTRSVSPLLKHKKVLNISFKSRYRQQISSGPLQFNWSKRMETGDPFGQDRLSTPMALFILCTNKETLRTLAVWNKRCLKLSS